MKQDIYGFISRGVIRFEQCDRKKQDIVRNSMSRMIYEIKVKATNTAYQKLRLII